MQVAACLVGILLATPPALHAQGGVRVRGQLFLPNGEPIGAVTRFTLASEDPRRGPEYYFTDSQGRFFLQGLALNQWYSIVVESDGVSYATTTERFQAGPAASGAYVSVHLLPLEPPKSAGSPSVSASRLAHQPPPNARKLYQQALRALQNGQLKPAAEKLRRVILLDPEYVDAYNELAVLAMGEKNYAEAESLLRQALAQDSEAPHPLLNLGITLNYLGRYAEAIAPLRNVLQLRPQWLASYVYLGIALLEGDQVKEAEPYLLRGTRAEGREQALAYLYLGKLYAQTGEREKAIAAWTSYLEKDPHSPNADRVRELLAQLGYTARKP